MPNLTITFFRHHGAQKVLAAAPLFLLMTACGGGGGAGTASTSTPAAIDTGASAAGVLCDLKGSGSTVTQVADNISKSYQFSWSCNATTRTIVSNGIPNHTVGTFPNPNNPNTIASYSVNQSSPLSPTLDTVKPVPIVGYALNGVKFDPNTGGGCQNNATSAATQGPGSPSAGTQCTYLGGGDWSLEAIVPGSPFDFGADVNNAHVQPTGEYHYHGAPTGVFKAQGGTETASMGDKMRIIGWAADGFPIYYKYGYSVATDATSALKKLVGNYKPNAAATLSSLRPTVSVFPLGTFRQDWAYSAGNGGDLDECNGRTGVTPEFPKGTYYYVATESYPYLQRCVRGKLV